MSDSTPTDPLGMPIEPLDATSSAAAVPVSGPVTGESKSRRLLYVLLAVGGALLLAVLVLLITLLLGGDDTATPSASPGVNSESATPSASPSITATPTPRITVTQAPPPTGPTFATFSAPTSAGCGADDMQKPLTFTWSSTDAERAWVGVQTNNAKDSPYSGELPPVHSYGDINYTCAQDSQFYTVTLENGDGMLAHKTVTITR